MADKEFYEAPVTDVVSVSLENHILEASSDEYESSEW